MTSKVIVEAINGDVQVTVSETVTEEIVLDNGDKITRDHYTDTVCVVPDGEKREWHVWKDGPSLNIHEKADAVD